MRKTVLMVMGLISVLLPPDGQQERFRRQAPIPGPLQELKLPEVGQPMVLSNGLTLSVAQRTDLPLISLQLTIYAGESVSPDSLPGLATFTAEMLSRGTEGLSAEKIEERIDALGGIYDSQTSFEYSAFSMIFPEDRLDEALDLLSQMVLKPSFSDHELMSLKTAERYNLIDQTRNPEFVAKRHLYRMLFQNHPFQKALSNEDVIKNISRKDLQSFYQNYYRPNNSHLVLVGNLNEQKASRKVSHYLNTWIRQDIKPLDMKPPVPSRDDAVTFVDHPGFKDAFIYFGQVIFPPVNRDIFPFLVLNQVLGGTMNSRLFMNLRETKTYANFAFSELEFSISYGVFLVRAQVMPQTIHASLQEITQEIQRISHVRGSPDEIELAKSWVIGHYPLQMESWEQFTFKVSQLHAFFNLGEEHWNKFYENIATVDADGVLEVARKYLSSRPVVVICGDKNVLSRYFNEFDRLDVYDIKGKFLYTVTKGAQ